MYFFILIPPEYANKRTYSVRAFILVIIINVLYNVLYIDNAWKSSIYEIFSSIVCNNSNFSAILNSLHIIILYDIGLAEILQKRKPAFSRSPFVHSSYLIISANLKSQLPIVVSLIPLTFALSIIYVST